MRQTYLTLKNIISMLEEVKSLTNNLKAIDFINSRISDIKNARSRLSRQGIYQDTMLAIINESNWK